MAQPDLRLVRLITRQLSAALQLRLATRADRAIDRIMLRTRRSDRRLDATFAAVQTMRDLDVVDRNEAAYLFNYMLDIRLWDHVGRDEPDPAIMELAGDPEHSELLEAAISHQDAVESETFYRSRGEFDLANLVVNDEETYNTMVAEGQVSIFDRKEQAEVEVEEKRSTDSSKVMEHVLALSSHEGTREWLKAWGALIKSLEEVTPETAVRAVQEAHAIGATDFEEHVRMMDDVLDDLLWDEYYFDREYARLDTKSDALAESLGIDFERKDEEQPFEYRMVEAERERRFNGLKAVVLRRIGEHRIANLVINDPAEYERILRDDRIRDG